MVLVNSHCHTTFSDGQLSVEEIAKLAKAQGITHLYLTDHHIPKNSNSTLDIKRYFKEIDRVNTLVNPNLKIYKGVELDFIKGEEDWFKEQASKGFDFVLGAIHNLTPERIYPVELPLERCEELTKIYFSQLRKLASSGLADSIAHFDLIKLSSDENPDWYKKEVKKTLKVIAKSKIAIEINTSATRKGAIEFHPSTWILQIAHEMGIPITIGTDAHKTKHMTHQLQEAIELARKIGYTQILRFKKRKPISIPI